MDTQTFLAICQIVGVTIIPIIIMVRRNKIPGSKGEERC